ncbi:M20 family metallopeptidase [Tetragenococcus solitarius]|uniref:Peptidase M20 domain-containing protein 2 n=1 Tax=Tetragenococcus solitarius TaxID=71453 RepID=A0ABP6KNY1_9ENTE|nr:M20 family metallopeptidase [Tetragenococcus solitarius]
MAARSKRDTTIQTFVRERLPQYKELALAIHRHPETSNHEDYSSDVLIAQLQKEGFAVKKDVAGHPTGFEACYKAEKKGPILVFLAEYDALAGIGHACGHNLFGTYSVLAASALKEVIDKVGGEIRVYGTPGEEGGENGSAKGSFVREGYFKDVDAALCVHPGYRYTKTSHGLACDPVDVKFYGVASHAAGAPEKGVSALESLIQTFNGVNSLRLYLPKDVNIHGIITEGGTAANVIPEYASGRFYLRAKNRPTLNDVYDKVENVIKGAAIAVGTTYEFGRFQNAVDDVIITPSFDEVFYQHAQEAGVPKEECDFTAKETFGSSDVGNVSQVVPTIQPNVSIADDYIVNHSEEFKQAACSEKGLNSIEVAAELLAKTALDLIEDPKLLKQIKEDHRVSLAKGN